MKVAHPCRKGTAVPPEWESRNSAGKAWIWMWEPATRCIESRIGDDTQRVSTRTELGILRC